VPPMGFAEILGRQLGSFVNAVTILAVAAMLVWFGLRPAVNSILTHRAPAEQAEVASSVSELIAEHEALPPADPEVNLVEDLADKMHRTPQKRLEQIIRLDEVQAAAILKQWMHEEAA